MGATQKINNEALFNKFLNEKYNGVSTASSRQYRSHFGRLTKECLIEDLTLDIFENIRANTITEKNRVNFKRFCFSVMRSNLNIIKDKALLLEIIGLNDAEFNILKKFIK